RARFAEHAAPNQPHGCQRRDRCHDQRQRLYEPRMFRAMPEQVRIKPVEAEWYEYTTRQQSAPQPIRDREGATRLMAFGNDEKERADAAQEVNRICLQPPGERLHNDPPSQERGVEADRGGGVLAIGPDQTRQSKQRQRVSPVRNEAPAPKEPGAEVIE